MKKLEKILYVEDDSDIQAIARLSLEKLGGYVVTLCSSGEEAVQKAPGFQPDMILLDVMMPGLDGPATFRKIKQIRGLETAPVVFVTARAQSHEVNGYRDLGVVDVITKPFDPMKLPGRIRDIWSRHCLGEDASC